jgi:hypothetical protein
MNLMEKKKNEEVETQGSAPHPGIYRLRANGIKRQRRYLSIAHAIGTPDAQVASQRCLILREMTTE